MLWVECGRGGFDRFLDARQPRKCESTTQWQTKILSLLSTKTKGTRTCGRWVLVGDVIIPGSKKSYWLSPKIPSRLICRYSLLGSLAAGIQNIDYWSDLWGHTLVALSNRHPYPQLSQTLGIVFSDFLIRDTWLHQPSSSWILFFALPYSVSSVIFLPLTCGYFKHPDFGIYLDVLRALLYCL